ncbi:lipase maturation factor 1 isoform X23 [Macaca fascicularis]|uniref:lipase maturation factor 1 isoform X23 n=1 Tax=Macaca fascicularis TaxID=9541 RepID=UPI003D15ED5B
MQPLPSPAVPLWGTGAWACVSLPCTSYFELGALLVAPHAPCCPWHLSAEGRPRHPLSKHSLLCVDMPTLPGRNPGRHPLQAILIVSGNLSFLNWLTMVPSLACFDDATLGFLFPSGPGSLKDRVLQMQREIRGARPKPRFGSVVRRAANVSLGILLAWLSVPVVLNLLSSRQVMNTHFNSLHIVNTYGAFGSITKERTEVILQGTASPNASAPDAVWEDYEFKCKPGDPSRRPCLISPYHYRLDWLMWFAAFQTYEHNDWILHLAGKLLASDAEALSLLAHNPFASRPPPRWVRGEHYRYKFSRPGGRHAAEGKWWVRKRIGAYFPPLSLEELRPYFRDRGWPLPQPL